LKDTQPPKIPGFDFIPVRFPRKPGVYGRNNKPHVTFDQVAKEIEDGTRKGTIALVDDDRGAANFIYGYQKNLPPLNPADDRVMICGSALLRGKTACGR